MFDIEKAKKMLLNPEYTLSKIVEETGSENLQAFSSSFKRETGMTPSRFRRVNEIQYMESQKKPTTRYAGLL